MTHKLTEGHLTRHLQGGTALRKFRAGNAGRFSTDLDFSAPGENVALDVLQAIDGADVDGFRFTVTSLGDDGRRGDLRVETPFGSPDIGAKLELSRHGLTLRAEILVPVPQPIHARYGFNLPALPVVRMEEASNPLVQTRSLPNAPWLTLIAKTSAISPGPLTCPGGRAKCKRAMASFAS